MSQYFGRPPIILSFESPHLLRNQRPPQARCIQAYKINNLPNHFCFDKNYFLIIFSEMLNLSHVNCCF